MSRRAKIWIILIALLVLIISGVFIKNMVSRQALTVSYKNISGVTIVPSAAEGETGKSDPHTTSVTKSGRTVHLSKGPYVITYTGSSGYANGDININLGDTKKTVTIDPPYSQSRLSSMLDAEFGAIKTALTQKYKNLSLYEVQKGKLYQQGEWYGTKLTYKGTDVFNSDTLRVVLHKVNGNWVVATDPPNISLSSILYPDVPIEVLKDVNNFL